MTTVRLERIGATLGVAALLAAGCGDDGGAVPDPTAPTSTSSTTVAPTTTPTASPAPPTTSTPPMQEGVRYLDPVFGGIETIENIVYWSQAPPLPQLPDIPTADLVMNLHLPAGDTEAARPAIIAFETNSDSWVIEHFVARGYVVATPIVRGRPSAPTRRDLELTTQGMVDGAAAVRWLRANAETHGIHPDAIAATGNSGAGILALALAWGQVNSPDVTEIDLFGLVTVPRPLDVDFGDHLSDQSSDIAAAFPLVAWYAPELIDAGEPPVIMFNGTEDPTYPFDAVERICPAAEAVGVTCVLRTFPTGHALRDVNTISVESAVFLYAEMLAPADLVDPATVPATPPDPAALADVRPVRIISPDSNPPIVPPPELRAIAVRPDGVVHVSSDTAIAAVDPSGATVPVDLDGLPEGIEPVGDSPPSRMITTIAVGPEGTLWAGGWTRVPGDGFLGGPAVNWVAARDCDGPACRWRVWRSDEEPVLDVDRIGALAPGPGGMLHAAADEDLLLEYDGSSWVEHKVTSYRPAALPLNPWSTSLAVAPDGTIWAATRDRGDGLGLITFDGSTFDRHDTETGLPGNRAATVVAAPDGTIWARTEPASDGSGDAVASLDGTTWTTHTIGDGFLSPARSVAVGADGTVWTVHEGTYARYDGSAWSTFSGDPAHTGPTVVGPDGTLWWTVGSELFSFDGTNTTIWSPFAD